MDVPKKSGSGVNCTTPFCTLTLPPELGWVALTIERVALPESIVSLSSTFNVVGPESSSTTNVSSFSVKSWPIAGVTERLTLPNKISSFSIALSLPKTRTSLPLLSAGSLRMFTSPTLSPSNSTVASKVSSRFVGAVAKLIAPSSSITPLPISPLRPVSEISSGN